MHRKGICLLSLLVEWKTTRITEDQLSFLDEGDVKDQYLQADLQSND